MKLTKRQIFYFAIFMILLLFLNTVKIPYYIYKPGRADPLDEIVEVEDGYDSEGSMHLLTVSGSHATPMQYIFAKFLPHREITPLEEIRPKGETDEEYFQRQLGLMENSQQSSTYVAYKAADRDVEIIYEGIYVVNVKENMPADGVLKPGDLIVRMDGEKLKDSHQLLEKMGEKKPGDEIILEFNRGDETYQETIEVTDYEQAESGVGIGIELITGHHIEVDPNVHFSSGNIGGPSAGLMFALDIYNQLVEEDLTKGYQVAGTGSVDFEGNVHSIGGVDKKVIAAHESNCDIFFVPNEHHKEKDSNYQIAKETAEQIDTDMEIVPVNTFDEAKEYLENLD